MAAESIFYSVRQWSGKLDDNLTVLVLRLYSDGGRGWVPLSLLAGQRQFSCRFFSEDSQRRYPPMPCQHFEWVQNRNIATGMPKVENGCQKRNVATGETQQLASGRRGFKVTQKSSDHHQASKRFV